MSFNPAKYGATFQRFLADLLLPPLDSGREDDSIGEDLKSLSVETAFGEFEVVDEEMARGCLAGLLLLHNFLDASHRVSQTIRSSTGSFWHGIMHRREGDFSNAKYWFRNTGKHPIQSDLKARAQEIATGSPAQTGASFLGQEGEWDPFAFVDLCQRASSRGKGLEQLCREVQMAEWELLFDYSFENATGETD